MSYAEAVKGQTDGHHQPNGITKKHHGHDSDSSSDEDVKRTQKGQSEDLPATHAASKLAIATGNPARLLLPHNLLGVIASAVYVFIQTLIALAFAPKRPKSRKPLQNPRGRIAVIGGGLTGVASAAHLIGHGFEVTIFEEHHDLGGIWSRVNTTSGLQLNSILYRFHPSVRWSHSYPKRAEILSEIKRLAEEYGLYERARLSTRVTKVERDSSSTDPNEFGHARWIVNGDTSTVYDGLIVSVGTCGKPKMVELPGQDNFKGKVVHSSELDNIDLTDKRVAVVGAGASGVEAVELALSKKCKSITMLARSAHWVIPQRSTAMQPFGRQMPLSFIPEYLIRWFHYGSIQHLAPKDKGLFTGTPIVNDAFLEAIRAGRVSYLIGDVKELVSDGVKFSRRENGSKPESDGKETHEKADVIVVATGFERPPVDFLPQDLFPKRGEGTDDTYEMPNLYLQNFPVTDWSVCMTNSAYKDAIGTVGHVHIGIFARILALFLADEKTRPLPADERMWVDMIRWIKRNAPGGALDMFSYMEMPVAPLCALNGTDRRAQVYLAILLSPAALRSNPRTSSPMTFRKSGNIIQWIPFTLCGFGMPSRG